MGYIRYIEIDDQDLKYRIVGIDSDNKVQTIYSSNIPEKIKQLDCPHLLIDKYTIMRTNKDKGTKKIREYTKCLHCNEVIEGRYDEDFDNKETTY